MNVQATRYVIITPVRNEIVHIAATLRSVSGQTIRPVRWIIVDDGSTDGTTAVLRESAAQNPWIRVVQRADRGSRLSATGVIEAFEDGYQALDLDDWDFLVKLDGDLSFAPTYFEQCFEAFERDPKLGIAGGVICHDHNGQLQPEPTPAFHVRGATKIYRHECWRAIGGLLRAPGWDTVDELKANMLGWKTYTLNGLNLLHHRHTGAADGSWRNAVKDGIADYVSGYHPLFMALKCVKRLVQRPRVVGSAGLLYGYIAGRWRQVPQAEAAVVQFVRQQQLRKLSFRTNLWSRPIFTVATSSTDKTILNFATDPAKSSDERGKL